MASHPPRTSAREERRLEIRRLVIASLASALAAVIVSQFSVAGTWIAAALTPVFVILIQEALHKPTNVIAERLTERDRRAQAPARRGEPTMRVYRSGAGGSPMPPRATRRRVAIGAVAVTALLAFVIAAFAITGTELLAGGSIGKSDNHTTLFGGDKAQSTQDEGTRTTAPEQAPQAAPPQSAPPGGAEHQGREQDKQQTTPAQPDGGQPAPAPQTTSP